MRNLVRAFALVVLTVVTLSATVPTNVQVRPLKHDNTDRYTLTAFNSADVQIGQHTWTGSSISGYYVAGCTCYHVPLSAFVDTPVEGMYVVSHHVNLVVSIDESTVEILD